MPLGTPIVFTLYGDNDEVKGEYSRARVPVVFAERAIELSKELAGEGTGQEQLQALYQIVVDFYGDKFTIEELRNGADLGELIAVIQAIANRAVELMPNLPNSKPPGQK